MNHLSDYTPDSVSREAWGLMRERVMTEVETMNPPTVAAARKWAQPLAHYYAWCLANGHELRITEPLIGAYAATLTFAPRTVHRNVSTLRSIGLAFGTIPPATKVSVPPAIETDRRPYTRADLERWWSIASAQTSKWRAHGMRSLIALGAGAGLHPRDIVALATSDVEAHPQHSSLVVVHLSDRVVPVDIEWAARVLELKSARSNGSFLGYEVQNAGLVEGLKHRAKIPADTPALTARRLRTTWLVNLMHRDVRIPEMLTVMGGRSTTPLEQLATCVEPRWDDGLYLLKAAGLA